MYPILEISTCTSFEKPSPLSQESKLESENSPFLKLLEEAKNSHPVEMENNSKVAEQGETTEDSSKAEETISQKTEQEIENELQETQEQEIDVSFSLPLRWEVSETLLKKENSSLENSEELETETTLELEKSFSTEISQSQIEEVLSSTNEEKNLETKLNHIKTNNSESSKKENLVYEVGASGEAKQQDFQTSTNYNTMRNTSSQEPENIFSNSDLEVELGNLLEETQTRNTEVFTLKTKLENSKVSHLENLEKGDQNVQTKESKFSSDLIVFLKDKITSTKEEKFEKVSDQNQLKQSFLPNVKTLVPKEEVQQSHEIKLTQTSEKENSNIFLTVQNIKSNSFKDANNRSVVYESSKSASQIFHNNTNEIVKTAKFQILDNGKNFAVIELEPKELGKVLLQISMENDKIHGKLFFETESAKLIFQSELQNLKNELRIAGLEIDSLLIDLNNPEQNPQEFLAFDDSSNPQAAQENSSQTEIESSEEISQTTKRLLDVRI